MAVKTIGYSPDQGLDCGAQHAGEQEEGRDQDVEEGQGGERHIWGQLVVGRDVDVDYKCLQDKR